MCFIYCFAMLKKTEKKKKFIYKLGTEKQKQSKVEITRRERKP